MQAWKAQTEPDLECDESPDIAAVRQMRDAIQVVTDAIHAKAPTETRFFPPTAMITSENANEVEVMRHVASRVINRAPQPRTVRAEPPR
jgi:hypothetical protein